MDSHCVYIITFPNDKFYVGCTKNLDSRIISHRSPTSSTYLSDEFEQHGKDNYSINVVCEGSKKNTLLVEGEIIDAFYDHPDCLNQVNPNGISTKVNKKISETIKLRHKQGRYRNSKVSAN